VAAHVIDATHQVGGSHSDPLDDGTHTADPPPTRHLGARSWRAPRRCRAGRRPWPRSAVQGSWRVFRPGPTPGRVSQEKDRGFRVLPPKHHVDTSARRPSGMGPPAAQPTARPGVPSAGASLPAPATVIHDPYSLIGPHAWLRVPVRLAAGCCQSAAHPVEIIILHGHTRCGWRRLTWRPAVRPRRSRLARWRGLSKLPHPPACPQSCPGSRERDRRFVSARVGRAAGSCRRLTRRPARGFRVGQRPSTV